MITKERKVILKDGLVCVLKTPEVDGEAEKTFYQSVIRETDFLLMTKDEAENVTAEGEEAWLKSYETNRSILIGAYLEGKLVGQISADRSMLYKVCHTASVGISVLKEAWGMGVATSLFEYLEDEARKEGITIFHLDLFSDNERAFHLYEKWGFQVCGVLHNGVRHTDGAFADRIMMEKLL